MITGILCILLSIVFFVFGVLNKKGNIKMVHSYHINNIKEEDVLPFGKLMGTGMFVIGVAMLLYGVSLILFDITTKDIYIIVSNIVLIAGLVLGCGISLYAVKKYNKKLFS